MGLVAGLNFVKEDHSTLVVASVDSLDEPTTFQNGVVMPFNLKHTPVLLDANGSISFLLPILLSLTKSND